LFNSYQTQSVSPIKKEFPHRRPAPEEFVSVNSSGPNPWSSAAQESTFMKKRDSQEAANEQKDKDGSTSSLYKTELCRSWEETGSCRYGNKCQFAHGKDELRPIIRHPKYKTEICKAFHTVGTCPYGTRCRFIHNTNEMNEENWSTEWFSSNNNNDNENYVITEKKIAPQKIAPLPTVQVVQVPVIPVQVPVPVPVVAPAPIPVPVFVPLPVPVVIPVPVPEISVTPKTEIVKEEKELNEAREAKEKSKSQKKDEDKKPTSAKKRLAVFRNFCKA